MNDGILKEDVNPIVIFNVFIELIYRVDGLIYKLNFPAVAVKGKPVVSSSIVDSK